MALSKKLIISALLVAIITAGTTWVVAQQLLQPRSLEKVTLGLGWVAGGKHAMFGYPSLDQGIYEKNGLSVRIVRGFGQFDTMKKVAARAYEFGEGDAASLVLARGSASGLDVKMIGVWYHKAPYLVAFLKGQGINTPKDLAGKTMGSPLGATALAVFPAFARAAGLDPQTVKIVPMDAAALDAALLTRKVDTIPRFLDNTPGLFDAAKKQGLEVGYFLYADYGFEMYTIGPVAREDYIKSNPDLVRRFVKATYEGMWWAIHHGDEAVDVLLKYHPELNRAITKEEFKDGMYLTGDIIEKAKAPLQLGWMDPAKMDKTAELMALYEKLTKPVRGEDLFTDEFVEKVGSS